MNSFTVQVIVVTCTYSRLSLSSASGLGLATATELLKARAYVAILDISEAAPIILTDEGSNYSGSRVLVIRVDVTRVDEVDAAVEKTVQWTKKTAAPLGGVINSAGMGKAELVSPFSSLSYQPRFILCHRQ